MPEAIILGGVLFSSGPEGGEGGRKKKCSGFWNRTGEGEGFQHPCRLFGPDRQSAASDWMSKLWAGKRKRRKDPLSNSLGGSSSINA